MKSIRSATEPDATEICRVVRASIRHLCVADHQGVEEVIESWTANKTAAAIVGWLSDPRNISLVSDDGHGRLAGIAMGTRLGHMLLLYVDPAHAGDGVGSRLLARFENELAGLGVAQMTADSTKSALDFYQSKGFVWGGETESFGSLTSYAIKKDVVDKHRQASGG
jgi:ribosomal protein S18 acetylase RimI-like enzyme